MGEGSCELRSGDDNALQDKNKKRKVKTPAQVQALENFYNEHKYPSEPMKFQLAESIGLTEKQVSGWFCHRRLKDKKIISEEKHATGGISGVIQDRGSGLKQDSCGSTKPGDDLNLDTREVESERLTPKVLITTGNQSNQNNADDVSHGSSSSMSNHQNGDLPFGAETTSKYPVPKFHVGEKTRSGPSGYLKVKNRVENPAITAVKRQLGKHFREEGPPLGVDFDQIPPGAFESSPVQDPVEESYYSEEAVLPSSPAVSKMRQNPNFGEGREFKPNTALDNPNIELRCYKTRPVYGIQESHSRLKFRKHASLPDSGVYYPSGNSSLKLPRDIIDGENRDEYGTRVKPRVEVMRTESSFSRNHDLHPYGGKGRDNRVEPWFHKYNNIVASKAPKGTWEEFPRQQYLNRPSVVDNKPRQYQVIRPSAEMPLGFIEGKESAETSSSMD